MDFYLSFPVYLSTLGITCKVFRMNDSSENFIKAGVSGEDNTLLKPLIVSNFQTLLSATFNVCTMSVARRQVTTTHPLGTVMG
jgi:hypothetical protein